ncbi:MAG: hypothetical protein JWN39_65 [Ilumatobacteraceae bacterium]|nr:hypothetical protein [Ilumatobacteraceae bacterium]
MLRAPVPIAAVDEHGNAGSTKHDVGPASESRHGSEVDSIPEATRMQNPPNPQLRQRVAAWVPRHPLADGKTRWDWLRHTQRTLGAHRLNQRRPHILVRE